MNKLFIYLSVFALVFVTGCAFIRNEQAKPKKVVPCAAWLELNKAK